VFDNLVDFTAAQYAWVCRRYNNIGMQDNNILHEINIPDSMCYVDCYCGMISLCANTKQKVCLANCSFTTSN